MNTELLAEMRRHLDLMVRLPSGFGTLEYTEGMIVNLIRVIYSLEKNCPFAKSTEVVDGVIADLTKDVPRGSNQAVFLCEKEAIPDRTQDGLLLRDRAKELIDRTIGRVDTSVERPGQT